MNNNKDSNFKQNKSILNAPNKKLRSFNANILDNNNNINLIDLMILSSNNNNFNFMTAKLESNDSYVNDIENLSYMESNSTLNLSTDDSNLSYYSSNNQNQETVNILNYLQ